MDKLFLSGNNTKAGVPELSREKIDQIILEASKGSKFYQHQQRRLQLVTEKTQRLRQTVDDFTDSELAQAGVQVEAFIGNLQACVCQDRVFVHVDMDAFFAAVEEQFDPKLAQQPMAVGGLAMLCTANYKARQFGVSAAMPGFIARRLCPDLVIVPLHWDRYITASEKMHTVFREYDPNFQSFSLDEASLDITDYVKNKCGGVEELVQELREKVRQKCRLTCSAGIGPTRQLAKMASNANKPDGQFSLMHLSRDNLLTWLHALPVKKICGVGKVTATILEQAFDVKLIGDLYNKQPQIWLGMTEKQAQFLVSASHGLAPSMYDTSMDGDDDDDDEGASLRKSISVERTYFPPVTKMIDMESKMYVLSELLLTELQQRQMGCCCVSIKVKLADFTVFSRSITVKHRVETVDEVFKLSCRLLHKLAPMDARLLGVRASALESTKPTFLDRFLAVDHHVEERDERVECPVCSLMIAKNAINDHLDRCLNIGEQTNPSKQRQQKKAKLGPMDAFICK